MANWGKSTSFSSYPCSRCDGRGIDWNSGICEPCEGSGKKGGTKSPALRHLEAELEKSKKQTEDAKYRADVAEEKASGNVQSSSPYTQSSPCVMCAGRGFRPRDDLWDRGRSMGMEKCLSCRGLGSLGKPDALVSRLWHEIDRINVIMRTRFSEWQRTAPPPQEAVSDLNNDAYLHILGLKENPTLDEIRRAYKKKAIEHHPDQGGTDLNFRVVCSAYEKLMEQTQ